MDWSLERYQGESSPNGELFQHGGLSEIQDDIRFER